MSGWMLLADSASRPTWTWQNRLPMWPAIPVWLAAALLAAAGLAMAWMIWEQQKIASRKTILTLAAIRGGLLLLLLVLMIQPALRWTHTTSSAGTLWLMLDGSRSMTMTDPQATMTERLRWADALGYLPKGSREGALDVHVAKLTWLKETLAALRPQTLPASAGPSDPRELVKFVKQVREWHGQLTQVTEGIEKDPQGKVAAVGITTGLRQAIKLLSDGLGHAQAETTMRAATDDVPWATLLANLDIALRDLKSLADASDQQFLNKHATDGAVQTALAKVSKLSRADLALQALTDTHKREMSDGGATLAGLMPKYRTKVASFADSAQAVPAITEGELEETLKSALSPSGKSTNIAAGLQLISEQVGGEENASVIILSDGRQNVAADATEAARLLSARGVKVYGLLLGSAEVSPDAAVEHTDAPDWIFKDDTVKATASIRLDGLAGKSLKVEFRRGDVLVDTQTVTAASNQEMQRVNFTDKPSEARGYEYSVRVEKAPGESNLDNNLRAFHVAVKKDKFFALLIDEQPRWEYQYVANYLARDQRVKVQTVLLTPARINGIESPKPVKATVTNGQVEAQLLPETKEEWQAYDMILLGDVPPESLSNAQQQFIAQAVRDKGATLVLMAGQHSMPARYANTPLADLLPVQVTSDWTAETVAKHSRTGFRPVVAPEGSASVLAQLGSDAESNAAAWGKAPSWYWHSEQTLAKPSASVIWAIAENDIGSTGSVNADQDVSKLAAARRRALLATQAVGLGRVLYLASDQTWRLRQVNGENLQDRFWGQVINWAAGTDLPAGGRYVRFGTNRPRYTEGEPVTITARVLREDLTPYTGQNFEVVAKALNSKDPKTPDGPAEGKMVDHARMLESPSAPGYYSAVLGGIRGQGSGNVEISLRGPEVERLMADDASATQKTLLIQVLPQLDLEQRNMNTDRATLQRITQAGGGVMLDGPYGDVLASHLPQLEQKHTFIEQVGLFTDPRNRWTHWVHWIFLIVFAGLLTAEWIVRKRDGLI